MDLRRAANRFETTDFDVYNEATDVWTLASFTAKLGPIDRFLSNFHRPTQRRLFSVDPAVTLPTNKTVRDSGTQDIYLLGQSREDGQDNVVYDKVVIAHLVSQSYVSGLAVVSRKNVVGTGTDLGVLVAANVGTHYAGVELRTAKAEEEQFLEYESAFVIVLPSHADLHEWDFITLNSITYKVESLFGDSGYKFGRITEMDDPRLDFTYLRAETPVYVPTTGDMSPGEVAYLVSGIASGYKVEEIDGAVIRSTDVNLTIEQSDIGFTPTDGDRVTVEGVTYSINAIGKDYKNHQWHLKCRM